MDFRLPLLFGVDVDHTLGCLHRVEIGCVVDVSEKYATLLNKIQH
jgi:hypothetical protein